MPDATHTDGVADLLGVVRAIARLNGHLEARLHDLGLTPRQAHVLREVAASERPLTATGIGESLGLDRGHLSRMVAHLEKAGLITRAGPKEIPRTRPIAATERGRNVAADADRRADEEATEWLERLSPDRRPAFAAALSEVAACLDHIAPPAPRRGHSLRPMAPGDNGWLLELHARVYVRGFGWAPEFEGRAAELLAKFLLGEDDHRAGWIAHRHPTRLGGCFVLPKGGGAMQLHCMAVDPAHHGRGIGRSLLDAAVSHARATGHDRMDLRTFDCLGAARRLYAAAGFQLVSSSRDHGHSFVRDAVEENWSIPLKGGVQATA